MKSWYGRRLVTAIVLVVLLAITGLLSLPARDARAQDAAPGSGGGGGASLIGDLINVAGIRMGEVSIIREAPGIARITVSAAGFDAVGGSHHIALTDTGRCEPPSFESAGSDATTLPDVQFYPDGSVAYERSAENVTVDALLDGDGSALVIYADTGEEPGERIACAALASTGIVPAPPEVELASPTITGIAAAVPAEAELPAPAPAVSLTGTGTPTPSVTPLPSEVASNDPDTLSGALINIGGIRLGEAAVARVELDSVRITVNASGFDPVAGSHRIALMQVGRCDPPSFESASYNDLVLPDAQFDPGGSVSYTLTTAVVTLEDLTDPDGSALVIYADRGEEPGDRIACAVLGIPQPGSGYEPGVEPTPTVDVLATVGIAEAEDAEELFINLIAAESINSFRVRHRFTVEESYPDTGVGPASELTEYDVIDEVIKEPYMEHIIQDSVWARWEMFFLSDSVYSNEEGEWEEQTTGLLILSGHFARPALPLPPPNRMEIAGEELVNGRSTIHYRADASVMQDPESDAGVPEGEVHLWIDSALFFPVRATIDGTFPLEDETIDIVEYQIDYYDFNAFQTVEQPSDIRVAVDQRMEETLGLRAELPAWTTLHESTWEDDERVAALSARMRLPLSEAQAHMERVLLDNGYSYLPDQPLISSEGEQARLYQSGDTRIEAHFAFDSGETGIVLLTYPANLSAMPTWTPEPTPTFEATPIPEPTPDFVNDSPSFEPFEVSGVGEEEIEGIELQACYKGVMSWSVPEEAGISPTIHLATDDFIPFTNSRNLSEWQLDGEEWLWIMDGDWFLADAPAGMYTVSVSGVEGRWTVRFECRDGEPVREGVVSWSGDDTLVSENYRVDACQKGIVTETITPRDEYADLHFSIVGMEADPNRRRATRALVSPDGATRSEQYLFSSTGAPFFIVVSFASAPWELRFHCEDDEPPVASQLSLQGDSDSPYITENYELVACEQAVLNWSAERARGGLYLEVNLYRLGEATPILELDEDTYRTPELWRIQGETPVVLEDGLYYATVEARGTWSLDLECQE